MTIKRRIATCYLSRDIWDAIPVNFNRSEFVEIALGYILGQYRTDAEFRLFFTSLRDQRQKQIDLHQKSKKQR